MKSPKEVREKMAECRQKLINGAVGSGKASCEEWINALEWVLE